METRRRGLNLWLASLIVLAVTLLPSGRTTSVQADTAGITVLASTAQNAFPTQILFGVRAQSTSQISLVRVAYRIGDDPVTFIADATYAPGFRIVATYLIDLQRDFLPPGVVIHYQWQVQDMSGAAVSTVWSELAISDPRFLWHERTKDNVVLHWYDGTSEFADAVLASGSQAFAVAQQDALAPWLGPVQVYLYATQADFRSALGLGAAEWTGGETFPTQHVSMIYAPGSDAPGAQRSVSHELTHAAIDGANQDPFGALPTWLDEGLAMVGEGAPDGQFTDALAKGIQAHHLFTVQSLSGNFPADTNDAVLAYAESDSIVRYYIKTYGRDHLAILIAAFHAGNTADEAFQTTVGVTSVEFQRAWLASLNSSPASSGQGQAAAPNGNAATDILSTLVRNIQKMFQSSKASPA